MELNFFLGGAGVYFLAIKEAELKTKPDGTAYKDNDANQRIGSVFLGAAGAIHLFQLVHSTLLTHKSNRKNGYAFKPERKTHLFLETAGLGLNLRLNF